MKKKPLLWNCFLLILPFILTGLVWMPTKDLIISAFVLIFSLIFELLIILLNQRYEEFKNFKEEKERELFKDILIRKAPNLSVEEVYKAYQIDNSFGSKLFFSLKEIDFQELINVDNFNKHILWNEHFIKLINLMGGIAEHETNDRKLNKIMQICDDCQRFVNNQKKYKVIYEGETRLNLLLKGKVTFKCQHYLLN